jgi:exoribonuclease-2
MLPAVIGAQRASLQVGQARPTVCTTVWLDAEGEVVRRQLSRRWVAVTRRLDYEQADRLISDGGEPDGERAAAATLRLLARAAGKLRARRVADGALLLQRPEWKIRVEDDGQRVVARPIAHDSASRQLVAEMMILANRLGAQMASEARLPVIYRVQAAPAEPLPRLEPGDPAAFAKLRGLLSPAQLSLNPGAHFGLGLPAYTQVTSPLRRYGDLVQQRQLTAHLAGEAPPYDAESLLRVLATVEAVEQESKKIEAAVTQRWALEYVDRLQDKRALAARVVGEANKGYRLALLSCGAQGTVVSRRPQQIGDELLVDVEQVKPRRGLLRLRLAE